MKSENVSNTIFKARGTPVAKDLVWRLLGERDQQQMEGGFMSLIPVK